MAWYERHFSAQDRVEFQRLATLNSLMKRWHDQIPNLPYPVTREFEGDPESHLGEKDAPAWIAGLKDLLRQRLTEWDKIILTQRGDHQAALFRGLRLTEEEALRYTSEQWKNYSSGLFPSVFPVYSAYRETPFYALYGDGTTIIRQTATEVIFTSHHPMMEMETAWMRGFVTFLRPSMVIEEKADSGNRMFHWRDS